MKQCPVCKTSYTDETLKFCLADGAALFSVTDPEKTIAMSFGSRPGQVNMPPDSVPTLYPPVNLIHPVKKSISPVIAVILGLLLVLLLICFAGFAAYIWLKPTDNTTSITNNSAAPTPTAAPKSDTNNTALKEKLANLEKQIADQKNKKAANSSETFSTPKTSEKTARVNSPGDGFLALRSEPNSESGYRLAKIPHGAVVTVLGCPKSSNIGKMSGHWCQVSYNGQSGWAFDAFMIF